MLQVETRSTRTASQRYRWNFDSVTDKDWFEGSPAISRWFDVYTLLVPDNEAFFIRTLVPCVAHMGGELEKAEMREFFRQEYLHGIAHRAYWKRMQQLGSRVENFVQCVNWWLYSIFERMQPHRLRVSVVAAIEHINASLSNVVLGKDLFRTTNADMKKLYYWHFSEEIEHKAVAYKALEQCYPGYWTRVLGAAIAFPCFFILTFGGMTYFLLQDHQCFKIRTLRDLYRFWIADGILKESTAHLGRYLRISFAPWDLDDKYLALENCASGLPDEFPID